MATTDPGAIRRVLKNGHKGDDVRQLQAAVNRRAAARRLPVDLDVDGEYGPATDRGARIVSEALGSLATTRVLEGTTQGEQTIIRHPGTRTAKQKARGVIATRKLRKELYGDGSLGALALKEAERLLAIGIFEVGGNNRGPWVEKIIRANGGLIGEPWCGDFCAYVYRNVGAKSVTRAWAAVRLIPGVPGLKTVTSPKPGDLVRFTFDHVGIYVRDLGNGQILCIEGNTGRSGAVSDSRSGGDGVYKKPRAKYLVKDYQRVTR